MLCGAICISCCSASFVIPGARDSWHCDADWYAPYSAPTFVERLGPCAGLLRGEVVALWHGITSNQHSSHNEDAQDSIPEEDNAVLEVEPLCTLKNDAKDENSDGIEMVAAHEKSLPEGQSHAV